MIGEGRVSWRGRRVGGGGGGGGEGEEGGDEENLLKLIEA